MAIFAASEAEYAWKMKALKQILNETGHIMKANAMFVSNQKNARI